MPPLLKFWDGGRLSNVADTAILSPTASIGINKIILYNTNAAAVTINLYVRKGAGTSRRITNKDYSLAIGEAFELVGPFMLENGDTLRGDASVNNVIDCSIFGFNE